MKKIVVIGGGTMGLDVAQCFARSGFVAVVRSTSQASIDKHQAKLGKSLDKLVAKGRMDEPTRDMILQNLQFSLDINTCADADLVLEAAPENIEIKKDLFAQLDAICKEDAVLASNTSTIPITQIAAFTKRPDRVIGMHFFNPATVMKLVEIIRAEQTAQETYDAVHEMTLAIGKTPVEVQDAPGFVVNKVLIPMINEAIDLVYTGVATPEDVDQAMKLGANHPMGPIALGDLIGLDVCLAIMDTLYSETYDPKYKASLLLRKMVRAGRLGRKSGRGFYDYQA